MHTEGHYSSLRFADQAEEVWCVNAPGSFARRDCFCVFFEDFNVLTCCSSCACMKAKHLNINHPTTSLDFDADVTEDIAVCGIVVSVNSEHMIIL